MTKLQIVGLVAVAAVSVTLALRFHRQAQMEFQANDAAARQLEAKIHELIRQQQALSNQLATRADTQSGSADELEKLRARAQSLREQTNQLAAQLEQNRAAAAKTTPVPQRPPEYFEKLHRAAGTKGREGRDLSAALLKYAWEHQGQFPASFDQIGDFLRAERVSLSGTNQFEIVYHGSLDALKNVPSGAVALLRDRQTFMAPSGKPARVYGLANGASQIVESDDDFKSWEAEHVVASAPGRQ